MRKTCQVQCARIIAGYEQLRCIEADLVERPCPSKQRAQLKVREYLPDPGDWLSVRCCQLQPIYLQAQYEWVDCDSFNAQFRIEILLNRINRCVLDQPWRKKEAKQRIHRQRRQGTDKPPSPALREFEELLHFRYSLFCLGSDNFSALDPPSLRGPRRSGQPHARSCLVSANSFSLYAAACAGEKDVRNSASISSI